VAKVSVGEYNMCQFAPHIAADGADFTLLHPETLQVITDARAGKPKVILLRRILQNCQDQNQYSFQALGTTQEEIEELISSLQEKAITNVKSRLPRISEEIFLLAVIRNITDAGLTQEEVGATDEEWQLLFPNGEGVAGEL
jgi:hypothetical protein